MYESMCRFANIRNHARVPSDFHSVAMVNGMVGDLRRSVNMKSVVQGEILVRNHLQQLGLRRVGNFLYQPVSVRQSNGESVHINAHEQFSPITGTSSDTISDIIRGMTLNSTVSIHWDHVSNNMDMIIKKVETMNNTSIPLLITSPQYISFKNVQYDLVRDYSIYII
jgi:hypothetical protein